MHRYKTKSSDRVYVVYQGKDDPRKHRESVELWFFAPVGLFLKEESFNDAFYSAEVEEHDADFTIFEVAFNRNLEKFEAEERRQSFRLVRSS